MTLSLLLQQLVNAIELGSIYAMIAVGLALVYGVLRILHVAQAGLYSAGAFIGLLFYQQTQSFAVALLCAMTVAGILGALIERFIYRPMLPRPRIVALIASIGLLICFSDIFRIIAGADQLAFDVPSLRGSYAVANLVVSKVDAVILAGTAVIFVLLWLLLQQTRLGFAIRAAAQDLETTELMGIDVKRSVSWMFFISSAIAAFGGVMIGLLYNAVFPDMGDFIAYKGLALIVIGGFGSLLGTVLASFLLAIAETILTTYTSVPLSREGVAMLFLVLLILIRPQGLLGRA
ncbi:MAG TPA: branched-chain amino acid ABC transporter permease [Xanthobacteraceae bacterium]|jgi:branched-chain amino acid transport system permease protein